MTCQGNLSTFLEFASTAPPGQTPVSFDTGPLGQFNFFGVASSNCGSQTDTYEYYSSTDGQGNFTFGYVTVTVTGIGGRVVP